MQRLFSLLLLLPGLAGAGFCPKATPLMKQYQNQKLWKTHEVSEPGVKLSLKGFIDESNNFFPEGVSTRVQQPVDLTVDPMNGDNGAFKNFCNDYDEMGDLLTAFRIAQSMNRYHLNLRYLPNMTQFSNDPFLDMNTHQFKVSVEVAPDSLIGRLPRTKELQEKIISDIESQLKDESPIGEYTITLNNWDDFACDLAQGKAKIGILRDMYSDKTFINMEENVPGADVKSLFEEWHTQLEQIQSRDKMMFTAGVVLESLSQQGKISSVSTDTALKMLKKVSQPGQKGLDWLGEQELACLSDSLQNYDQEFTQYQYNVIFDVNKQLSLHEGE